APPKRSPDRLHEHQITRRRVARHRVAGVAAVSVDVVDVVDVVEGAWAVEAWLPSAEVFSTCPGDPASAAELPAVEIGIPGDSTLVAVATDTAEAVLALAALGAMEGDAGLDPDRKATWGPKSWAY